MRKSLKNKKNNEEETLMEKEEIDLKKGLGQQRTNESTRDGRGSKGENGGMPVCRLLCCNKSDHKQTGKYK